MKRNIFSEPVPANLVEIEAALVELDFVMDNVSAMIDFNQEDGEFHGFTAEIMDHSQDRSFSTLGYESKERLVEDLHTAGIELSQINEY